MKMNKLVVFLLSSIVFLFSEFELNAQHLNTNKDGVAIEGYDPVSYVRENTAIKGSAKLAVRYKGTIYWFSTVRNKELFLASPEKYLPAYGGWCAFAMGDYGEKVEVDPKTFKIIDGKAYLFYNKFFTNTLLDWNKNEPMLTRQADINWKKWEANPDQKK